MERTFETVIYRTVRAGAGRAEACRVVQLMRPGLRRLGCPRAPLE